MRWHDAPSTGFLRQQFHSHPDCFPFEHSSPPWKANDFTPALDFVKHAVSFHPRALLLVLPPVDEGQLLALVNRYHEYQCVIRDGEILDGEVFYDPDSHASIRAKNVPLLWFFVRA